MAIYLVLLMAKWLSTQHRFLVNLSPEPPDVKNHVVYALRGVKSTSLIGSCGRKGNDEDLIFTITEDPSEIEFGLKINNDILRRVMSICTTMKYVNRVSDLTTLNMLGFNGKTVPTQIRECVNVFQNLSDNLNKSEGYPRGISIAKPTYNRLVIIKTENYVYDLWRQLMCVATGEYIITPQEASSWTRVHVCAGRRTLIDTVLKLLFPPSTDYWIIDNVSFLCDKSTIERLPMFIAWEKCVRIIELPTVYSALILGSSFAVVASTSDILYETLVVINHEPTALQLLRATIRSHSERWLEKTAEFPVNNKKTNRLQWCANFKRLWLTVLECPLLEEKYSIPQLDALLLSPVSKDTVRYARTPMTLINTGIIDWVNMTRGRVLLLSWEADKLEMGFADLVRELL